MKSSLSAFRWLPVLACALAAVAPTHAGEWSPKPVAPLKQSADTARVIVKFKETASDRARIASAGHGSAAAAQALQQRAGALGSRLGLALKVGHAMSDRMQVVMASGMNSAALAARLGADADVEYAVVDGRARRLMVPNDPLYVPTVPPVNGPAAGQWYLKPPAAAKLVSGSEILSSIDIQGAWDITIGDPNLVVAVLDTGVRPEHPDLSGKLLPGYDMVSQNLALANDGNERDNDPSDPGDWISESDRATETFSDCDLSDSSWHGTIVSGIIGASTNDGVGMAGSGWNVKVLPVRVLGKCFGYESDIIAGMRWAAGLAVPGVPANTHPARVINLSLGGVGACSDDYRDAIAEVNAAGAVVVAAAGNTTGKAVNNPANCPGVIGVAAVRHIGTKVGFSDVGPEITVAAPGGNCVNRSGQCIYPILSSTNAGTTTPGASTYSDGNNASVGTSFAAPLVSGTAALMLSANPLLTPAQVKNLIMATARVFPYRGSPADPDTGAAVQACHPPNSSEQLECYCSTSTCGAGMLDASWAVYSAKNGAPTATITPPTNPVAGQLITFSSANSVAASGRSIVSQEWTVIDSEVGNFTNGATATGASVTMTPTGAGRISMRLIVTDSAGIRGVHEQLFVVAAAPPPPVTPPSTPATSDSGGGGAMSAAWLAALALAVGALGLTRRRA